MMFYIPGRKYCILLVWVFVGLQTLTVILIYSFHSGDNNLRPRYTYRYDVTRDNAHDDTSVGDRDTSRKQGKRRAPKKLLAQEFNRLTIKPLYRPIRGSNEKGFSVEGDVIHLHIHGGKVVIHSDEISEEDFIRIKSNLKPKVKHIKSADIQTKSPIIHSEQKKTVIKSKINNRTTKKPSLGIVDNSFLVHKDSKKQVKNDAKRSNLEHMTVSKADGKNMNKLAQRITTTNQNEINEFVHLYVKECEKNTLNVTYIFRGSTKTLCPCLPGGLGIIPVKVSQSTNDSPIPLSNKYDVRFNGIWRPTTCVARQRIAVIVPYRNRKEHLDIFLAHMHNFLQKQMLEYCIVIVEQISPKIFNRAALMNVGFMEANRLGLFHCFIFHDVDLLPEDSRNMYTCTTSPRHVAVAVDKFRYQLQYPTIVGGALAVTRDQMLTINGFSNKFYGWGGEDDDMYNRIRAKNYRVKRYPEVIGRYTMLNHFGDDGNPPNPTGAIGLEMRREEYEIDGLNTLKYDAQKPVRAEGYTLIKVHIQ